MFTTNLTSNLLPRWEGKAEWTDFQVSPRPSQSEGENAVLHVYIDKVYFLDELYEVTLHVQVQLAGLCNLYSESSLDFHVFFLFLPSWFRVTVAPNQRFFRRHLPQHSQHGSADPPVLPPHLWRGGLLHHRPGFSYSQVSCLLACTPLSYNPAFQKCCWK